MNKYAFFALLMMFSNISLVKAQSISYSYDAGGNRISRSITVSQIRRKPTAKEEESAIAKTLSEEVKVAVDSNGGSVVVEISSLKSTDKCSALLYSLSGQLLRSLSVVSSRTVFDLSPFPAGVYIIHVTLNGKTDSWKVDIR